MLVGGRRERRGPSLGTYRAVEVDLYFASDKYRIILGSSHDPQTPRTIHGQLAAV